MKQKIPFVRSPYNYDTNEVSDETGINTGEEGGAKQSFKEECDINTIVARFGLGYELPETHRVPQYGDFSNITDFQTAMNATARAREAFDQLPANIRTKFNNDPGQYVDFCLNPDNINELKEMGLLNEQAQERLKKEAENKQKPPAKPREGDDQGGGT